MSRIASIVAFVLLLAAMAVPASATSGKITANGAKAPVCTDEGTTVECTVKVTGLGGDTFQVLVTADGIASVECTNPGGNVAPGQDSEVTVDGASEELDTPRNGSATVTVETSEPDPVPFTCPNDKWEQSVVDVSFTTATITLLEDGVESDQVTVDVQ